MIYCSSLGLKSFRYFSASNGVWEKKLPEKNGNLHKLVNCLSLCDYLYLPAEQIGWLYFYNAYFHYFMKGDFMLFSSPVIMTILSYPLTTLLADAHSPQGANNSIYLP
jgi:hypothetical protein